MDKSFTYFWKSKSGVSMLDDTISVSMLQKTNWSSDKKQHKALSCPRGLFCLV